MKNVNWVVVVAVGSPIATIVAATYGFIRNRRTDTITLYSSFVDDLHEEVTRLRSQYEEDRKKWDSRERDLLGRIERLRNEISNLQDELDRLRKQITNTEVTPSADPTIVSSATKSLLSEFVRQMNDASKLDD